MHFRVFSEFKARISATPSILVNNALYTLDKVSIKFWQSEFARSYPDRIIPPSSKKFENSRNTETTSLYPQALSFSLAFHSLLDIIQHGWIEKKFLEREAKNHGGKLSGGLNTLN